MDSSHKVFVCVLLTGYQLGNLVIDRNSSAIDRTSIVDIHLVPAVECRIQYREGFTAWRRQ